MQNDYLIKALALNDEVRVYILKNTNTVNEAIRRHDLWPTASSVLGKTISMGQIMGGMLKGDQAITIKINGKGQLGNIIVDANARSEVRAYVDNPHVSILSKDKINDSYGIGSDGYLDVIKDLKLKDLFTSSIALSGDLSYDFAYYFLESEQTPTANVLAIKIGPDNLAEVSGGIVFQLLPNASEESISFLENALITLKEPSELFINNSCDEILKLLFGKNYRILEQNPVRFHCPCNKEHFARGLISLGKEELEEILTEDKKIEIICHYCNDEYLYDEEEIKNIIKEINK